MAVSERISKRLCLTGEFWNQMVYDNVTSALACAVVLCRRLKWTTFGVLTRSGHFLCQMSKKKGSSMERSEAFVNPGSRMHQNKVKGFLI
jgi:hypothetical protein